MPPTVPENHNHHYEDKYFKMLLYTSRLLGVLPFQRVVHINRSFPYLVYSVFLICFYDILLYFHWFEFDIKKYLKSDKFLAIFSYYVTWLTTLAVPWMSLCWLNFKLKQLDGLYLKIESMRKTIKYPKETLDVDSIVYTVVMAVLMVTKEIVDNDYELPKPTVILYVFPHLQVFCILFQFTTLVKMIRKYYSHLIETLSTDNALSYVRQTDILWSCSRLAMECWAPQLFLLIVASFSIIVSSFYMTIVVWMTGDEWIFIISTLMFCLLSFYIVSTCSETRNEVKIEMSRPLLYVSLITVLLPYVSFVFIKSHMNYYEDFLTTNFFLLSYAFPLSCLSTVPIMSLYRLTRKLKKLQKTFDALQRVSVETSHEFRPLRNRYPHFVPIAFLPVYIGERLLFGPSYAREPSTYINFFTVFLVVLVVSQFTSLLRLIRNRYEYLTKTLDVVRAPTWLYCHELLGACCRNVSTSYAAQLLLIITSSFVYVVFQTYFVVESHKIGNPEVGIYVFLFWISFFIILTWFIVYNCRFTKLEAKKFDKLLYHLIINDNSKTLLKNKRILLHFKAKRKEEFSAMGFFNFDYPLLCSMVSSATTYIVILVQFS